MSQFDYLKSPFKCIETNKIGLTFAEKGLLNKWVIAKNHEEVFRAYFDLSTDKGKENSIKALELESKLLRSL